MKKSQGEIFGIALLFVVLIFGIILYGQFKALNPDSKIDDLKKNNHKILAEGTLNTLLKKSTGCYTQRERDSVIDLIEYCLYNYNSYNTRVELTCLDGDEAGQIIDACSYPKEILKKDLDAIFNNTKNFQKPYFLSIDIPSFSDSPYSKINITNFNDFQFKNNLVNSTTYRKLGFSKAHSGLFSYPTSFKNIDFELSIYYR